MSGYDDLLRRGLTGSSSSSSSLYPSLSRVTTGAGGGNRQTAAPPTSLGSTMTFASASRPPSMAVTRKVTPEEGELPSSGGAIPVPGMTRRTTSTIEYPTFGRTSTSTSSQMSASTGSQMSTGPTSLYSARTSSSSLGMGGVESFGLAQQQKQQQQQQQQQDPLSRYGRNRQPTQDSAYSATSTALRNQVSGDSGVSGGAASSSASRGPPRGFHGTLCLNTSDLADATDDGSDALGVFQSDLAVQRQQRQQHQQLEAHAELAAAQRVQQAQAQAQARDYAALVTAQQELQELESAVAFNQLLQRHRDQARALQERAVYENSIVDALASAYAARAGSGSSRASAVALAGLGGAGAAGAAARAHSSMGLATPPSFLRGSSSQGSLGNNDDVAAALSAYSRGTSPSAFQHRQQPRQQGQHRIEEEPQQQQAAGQVQAPSVEAPSMAVERQRQQQERVVPREVNKNNVDMDSASRSSIEKTAKKSSAEVPPPQDHQQQQQQQKRQDSNPSPVQGPLKKRLKHSYETQSSSGGSSSSVAADGETDDTSDNNNNDAAASTDGNADANNSAMVLCQPAAAAGGANEGGNSNNSEGRILLYTPEDHQWLSDLLCFVRKQIEVFTATAEDVAARSRRGGIKKPIAIGRVGIRCVHCAHVPPDGRAKGAVSYPNSIRIVHQAVRNWQRYHFMACPHIPQDVKDAFKSFRTTRCHSGNASLRYWVVSCGLLGMHDTDPANGIRLDSTKKRSGAAAAGAAAADGCSPMTQRDLMQVVATASSSSGPAAPRTPAVVVPAAAAEVPPRIGARESEERKHHKASPAAPAVVAAAATTTTTTAAAASAVVSATSAPTAFLTGDDSAKMQGFSTEDEDDARSVCSDTSDLLHRNQHPENWSVPRRPLPPTLLDPSDPATTEITPYLRLLLAQQTPTHYTAVDRLGKRRFRPLNFPGVECRHCSSRVAGSGRYFPLTATTFANNNNPGNCVESHVRKCRRCPQPIKDDLAVLAARHVADGEALEVGWKRRAFDRIWKRLHGEDGGTGGGGADTSSSLPIVEDADEEDEEDHYEGDGRAQDLALVETEEEGGRSSHDDVGTAALALSALSGLSGMKRKSLPFSSSDAAAAP